MGDSLTIVNLPPDTEFELTVTPDNYEGSQVTTFTTPSSGSMDIGVIFESDYPHFISYLKITQHGTDFKVTWTDPSQDNYSGLKIDYLSEDGTMDDTYTASPGDEEFILTNVPEVGIDFTFQALYSVGDDSVIVTKHEVSAVSYTLTLFKENDTEYPIAVENFNKAEMYYYYEDLASYVIYTTPVEIPAGVSLNLEMRKEDVIPQTWNAQWEYHSGVMDSDLTLTMYCVLSEG